jgi:PAS domain-containing protein
MSSSLPKDIEEELRASEARYRTFVDHATDAFMLHAEDGTVIDVNPQALRQPWLLPGRAYRHETDRVRSKC